MMNCARVAIRVGQVVAVGVLLTLNTSLAQINPFNSSAPGYPNWSAFSGLRWEDDKPIVQVNDQWYELMSFHGIPTEDILNACRVNRWPVRRRFREDLVQIVRLMGHDIDKTTDLVLKDEKGETFTMKGIEMTLANLERLTKNPFHSRAPGYPTWSAFSGLRWKDGKPMVQVDDDWYELVSFHGIPTQDILNECRENGWQVRTRFAEDLVQIVRLMGHEINKTTDLVLKDETGKTVTMKNVAMTEANRRRIIGLPGGLPGGLDRFKFLHDLAFFEQALESQFSYLGANGVDYKAAIDAIRRKGSDGMESAQLAVELQTVIALFIDGHASVSGSSSGLASDGLPFLMRPSGDRFVAVRFDRSDFVDSELPYIRAIDGIKLEDWLDATHVYVPKGSPQYLRRYGLRMLHRHFGHFREKLGLPSGEPLRVEVVSRDGATRRTITPELPDGFDAIRLWPPMKEPQILEGNVGYLRLAAMNGDAVAMLAQWLPRFRDTDGLIVDVRGNGGGVRTPILELAGYLLTEDDAPRIANVAKYRLAEHFGDDHLSAARYVYVEESPQFDDREREAVRRIQSTFEPEWLPPAEQFSPWHYLVLSKRPDDVRFDYRQPVAILMDEGCFSATDIFLGAFKGWPNMTLVGQPSGGGSARSSGFELPNSGIRVRCASMASFQPSGQLYDGNGIAPDLAVIRPPEYYLLDGPDVILEKALDILKRRPDSSE